MKLLLDTHIAVWSLTGDRQLSARARSILGEAQNDIVISVVVLWEIAIKRSLARGGADLFPFSPQETYDFSIRSGAEILPVTPQHAFAVERLPPLHRDPFDRLLVAQALSEPLRLVTHDMEVAAYSDTVILV
jgi:PIN domain nuclease of toxin-antitoxin system